MYIFISALNKNSWFYMCKSTMFFKKRGFFARSCPGSDIWLDIASYKRYQCIKVTPLYSLHFFITKV